MKLLYSLAKSCNFSNLVERVLKNSTLTLLRATDLSSMQQLQAGLNSLQNGLQAFDFHFTRTSI